MNEPGTPSMKAIRKAQRELHTQRERVNENERLVAAVFQALRQTRTPGLRYATIRKADGVSFSHLVAHGEADSRNALTHLPRRENAAPFQKGQGASGRPQEVREVAPRLSNDFDRRRGRLLRLPPARRRQRLQAEQGKYRRGENHQHSLVHVDEVCGRHRAWVEEPAHSRHQVACRA